MKKLIVFLIVVLLVELAILAVQRSRRNDGAPRNVVEIAMVVEAP